MIQIQDQTIGQVGIVREYSKFQSKLASRSRRNKKRWMSMRRVFFKEKEAKAGNVAVNYCTCATRVLHNKAETCSRLLLVCTI